MVNDNISYEKIITEENRLRLCINCNHVQKINGNRCLNCDYILHKFPNQLPSHYEYRFSTVDGCIYFININLFAYEG